ncbi:N-acetylmuramoyl-L-alanine amidase [Amaricoccus macauensis]|uniref:N-acetylmuramoyl-L-alanine amidase n=1 Tax=Amaricoccus macauensis TaxID=57001 RepID=UPI003C7A4A09
MSPIGPITHVVIHYSATYPDQNLTAADIDRMHRARTPPFRCIGYHLFIRRDGSVETGRTETEQGAHVIGQNAGKIGICWAGGLERDSGAHVGVNNMAPTQEESLIRLIRDLRERYPGAKVVGHRDLAPTQCPGFDVIPWWAEIERAQAEALAGADQPTPAAWLARVWRTASRVLGRT